MDTLFGSQTGCNCERCGAKCKVDPLHGSRAKILKRSKVPKGLCINCAVHDFLRNTYPVNMLLAGMRNPECLLLPHLQQQFAVILRSGFSDAKSSEINWRLIIDKWDLPFPNKVKRSSMNPMNDEDLAREPEEEARREHFLRQQIEDPRSQQQKLEDAEKMFLEEVVPFLRKGFDDEDS